MTTPGWLLRQLTKRGLALRTAEDTRNAALIADAHLVLDEAGILAGPLSDRLAALVRVHEAARRKCTELLAGSIAAWDEADRERDDASRHRAAILRIGTMVRAERVIPPFLRRVA